ncbi:MAG TPA: sialidase family protein [Ktedonobacteraceae bacterium]|nr:sialidase family protein [Ktedonobacteraceae bacterium]
MKKIISVLGTPLFVGLLLLVGYASPVSAQSSSNPGFKLPNSPVSTGVLIARGIRNGTIHLQGNAPGSDVTTDLNCKPAPCTFKDRQVSEGGRPANETPVVANPKKGRDLLTGANDYNCPNIQGFYSSTNGGRKWSTFCMQSYAGGSGDGDPTVGYDLNGNSYIGGIDEGTPDGSDIIFQKSSNNGQTWSAPAPAVKPILGGLTDKDWMQIDVNPSSPHANAIYFSVTQFNGPENADAISVSHSDDGGSTWKTVQVDTVQNLPNLDQFSDLAIGKDGTVYVSWMRCLTSGSAGDCGGTKVNELVSKSTDGGNTWSSPVTIAQVQLAPDSCGCAYYGNVPNTRERVSNIPAIDIDNSNGSHKGNLYATFYNYTGSQMQVEVATSTNGGSSWAAPVRVTTAAHDEFFPWLTVSATGIVGVTWNDRRNDPSNLSYEEFGTLSNNGGSSFGTNYQIASQPSNPNNDGFGGSFIGDYTGNYWNGKKLYAVWTDTRTGNDQEFIGGIKNNA